MRRIKDHTSEKLEYIKKYVGAYLLATKKIPVKYYLDAFAGTGRCVLCNEKCQSKGSKCNCGKGKIVDGSALIAIKSQLPFNKYFLFELSEKKIKELEKSVGTIETDRNEKVRYIHGDCNAEIPRILKETNGLASYLVLLDPEGPELIWETIECLSKVKRMDILILFPYDMSLSRLVKDHSEKNDKFFGSVDWREIHSSAPTIPLRKKNILEHFLNNLRKLGFTEIRYKLIRSRYREGNPLYHFILVSRAPVATKIMNDIFNKELDAQLPLLKID